MAERRTISCVRNAVIKRRTNVVGIFPNNPALVRLVGSKLLEQQEEWQLERCRFISEPTMAKIPDSEGPLELTVDNPLARQEQAPAEAHQLLYRSKQKISIVEL